MHYILTTQNLPDWTLSKVGGKGLALAELFRIGIRVPEALCFTTDAYGEFIEQPKAMEAVQTALASLGDKVDAERLTNIADSLREALLEVPIPTAASEEIKASYQHLGGSKSTEEVSVAVRSSATAEDLPNASFAGQHESFLFIRGAEVLLESVRKCWVSLWTARAIAYRAKQGIADHKVAMAVILQRMVNAEVSGVLFTINALTGARSQMIVNAVYGLGEALVSGQATPDEWVLDKNTGRALNQKIADKKTMMVEDDGELVLKNVPAAKRRQPALSTEQLMELNEIGVRLEKHFQQPQDIEWALEDGALFILQCRPITTQQQSARSNRRFEVEAGYWTRVGLGEWLQQPLSPLFSTFVLPELNSIADSFMEARLGVTRASPTWLVHHGYYFLRGDIVFTIRLFLTPILFLQNMLSVPDEWSEVIVPNHIRQIQQLRDFDFRKASASDILEHFEGVCKVNALCWAWIILTGIYAKITEWIFARLYQFVMHERGISYGSLLTGFPNKSIEADQALWELAEAASGREDLRATILENNPSEALGRLAASLGMRDWQDGLHKWLANYGHRVFDLDIVHETVQDNPAIALQIIRNYIENPTESPAVRQKHRAEERKAAELVFQTALARKSLTKCLIKKCFSLAQRYAAIRESRPFFLHLGWPLMRRDALELGRRLAGFRVLEDPEEVFFVTSDDLRGWAIWLDNVRKSEDLGNQHMKIRERWQEWEDQKALVPPDHINPNPLVRFIYRHLVSNNSGAGNSSHVLAGFPASPGKARGRTCTVRSQSEFGKVKKGQIIVAPYTTPAWTTLFPLAAGVITETGGVLSHAAIIAREYGIPAVVGVEDVLTRLPDGTDVDVDGDAGCVYLKDAGRETKDE